MTYCVIIDVEREEKRDKSKDGAPTALLHPSGMGQNGNEQPITTP